jgi:hypothetical protein
MKTDLRLDWCSYEAAKYAVEHWHYSQVLPYGTLVKIGAWENEVFIGCVLFAWGANKNIGSPYGLEMTQVCELVRVALGQHSTPTSKIVSLSIKMLKRQSPNLRLIVSYADTEQNHLGIIYQATNWIYTGTVKTTPFHFVNRRWMKQRMASATLGSVKGTQRKAGFDKIKYLYPLDEAMRAQIEPLRKPYPKRGEGETDNAGQSNAQTEGARPISPLLQVTE